MKGMKLILIVIGVSLLIAFFWDKLLIISHSVHFILDPSAGKLLNYNLSLGVLVIAAIVTFFMTLVQKYTIDNESLRELKKEQKKIQEDIKYLKDNPEKLMELQKKSLSKAGEIFSISMKSITYTAIPIILFFRWFNDYFTMLSPPAKIFGIFSTSGSFIFPSWLWAYILVNIFLTIFFRKLFRLP